MCARKTEVQVTSLESARMEINLKSVTQLNSSSYVRWRFEIQAHLEANDVFDVADGSREQPTDATLADWKKKDALARSLLSKSLDDAHFNLVVACKSSADMWKTLVGHYDEVSNTTKLAALEAYNDYHWKDDMTVTSYISGLMLIENKLKAQKLNIEKEMIITKIVRGLPQKFDNFKQVWRICPTKDITVEQLQAKLLDVERDVNVTSSGNHGVALSGQKDQKDREVFKGKKKAGWKKDRKKLQCHNCKGFGHFARDCPSEKKDTSSEGRSSSNRVAMPAKQQLGDIDEWIGDSGAYSHITRNSDWFVESKALDPPEEVKIGDGRILMATAIGKINVTVHNGKEWVPRCLKDVRLVPDFGSFNLFSIVATTDLGYEALFSKSEVVVKNSKGEVIVRGIKKGHSTYRMLIKVEKPAKVCTAQKEISASWETWHRRLGHAGKNKVKALLESKGYCATGKEDFFCEACIFGKMTKGPYKEIVNKDFKPGAKIHCDLSGKVSIESAGGCKYFAVFVDESSGYKKVAMLKKKELVEEFKKVIQEVKEETGHPIEILRTDQGTEFIGTSFQDLLKEHKIKHEMSVEYTPQSNGMAERAIRSLTEKARSLLADANLPKFMWAECVSTACYLSNLVATRDLKKTSYELWHGKEPSIEHLRAFGCDVFVHIPKPKRNKFDKKARKGQLIGYGPSTKLYRVYFQDLQDVRIARDVKFNEGKQNSFYVEDEIKSLSNDETYEVKENDSTEIVNEIVKVSTHPKSTNVRKPSGPLTMKLRNRSIISEDVLDEEQQGGHEVLMALNMEEPKTAREALEGKDSTGWQMAMQDELDSFAKNDVVETCVLPSGKNVIDTGWVLKIKRYPNGEINKLKARIVCRGYSQKRGIDFTETFAPVVRMDSIRILLAIAAHEKLVIKQCDVKSAFLYGDIEEEIYVRPPDAVDIDDGKVWKLKKSLYGLKQSPRNWNKKFNKLVTTFGLIRSIADPCIYYGNGQKGRLLLAIYVDDILVAGQPENVVTELLDFMRAAFEIKIEEPTCFLGLELNVDRRSGRIRVNQQGYIRNMLARFGMENCNKAPTPGEVQIRKHQLTNDETFGVPFPYRQAIGCLLYAATHTRPDISFQVNHAARAVEAPTPYNVKEVKRIFRYLKGTMSVGIQFGEGKNEVVGYCDSDYAGCPDTAKSTYGHVFVLNGGPISWESRKSTIVADSTTVAELQAAYEASKQAIWIKDLMKELMTSSEKPIIIYCDNEAAVKLSKSEEIKKKTKHVNVRFNFLRQTVGDNNVEVKHIAGTENPADMLTKPLPHAKLLHCCNLLFIE